MHTVPVLARIVLPAAALAGLSLVVALRSTRRPATQPMEELLDRAREEGRAEGHQRGLREGIAQGFVLFLREEGVAFTADELDAVRYAPRRHLKVVPEAN
ncbi:MULTISPECIES: hypothetical protein [Catenuloplanes]|uniref:Uncharacterized protein n=1 Tax=Catenuloplanes niger TaxID=587534 RepID=A0AAE3ZRB2_9ACTN|nr:hypothetical protein [Catenuloplanes niger]MDR7323345.1 hypothetical protein [Catenuloplanes niger]